MNLSNSWHLLDNGEVLRLLGSDMYQGLSSKEAKKRRRASGPNSVWHVKRTPAGEIALSALFDLPTLLLAVSAGAAAVFDKRFEAGAIAAVLAAGALMRTAAAVRANRILEDLARERIPHSSVIRDGRIHLLPAGEIVPGDIIFLEPGDTVPCDGRVMTGEDAVVSERGITENSLPVHKFNTVIATDAESGEIPCEFRSNMLFAGSLVLSGSVRIAATACGEDTLVSMKQGGVTIEAEHNFPLVERLRKSGRAVSLSMLAAVLVLTVLSIFVGDGMALPDVFLCTMAMAVAAMSEFMPAVASIILASAVRDAASGREPTGWLDAVKRRLLGAKAAVTGEEREERGCRAVFRDPARMEEVAYPDAVVFCGADYFKSGNAELLAYRFRGTYTGIDEEGGDPSELLSLALAAASQTAVRARPRDDERRTSGRRSGSHRAAGRAALVSIAADACAHRTGKPLGPGLTQADHRDSTDRLAMNCEISLVWDGGELWAVACGAIQDVLACCSTVETADGTVPLTDDEKKKYFAEAAALEFGGARVLAVSRRTSPYPQLNRLAVLTQAMSFTGFFAVALEPEAGARESIACLKESGARPILFTETPDEDRYYCRRIGLFDRDTQVIPFAEWNAIRAKEILSDRDNAKRGLIVSFEDIGDQYLGGAFVQAMTALGAADGEAVIAAVGREAWDAGALGRADYGLAVSRSKTRAVPDALARNAAAVIYPDAGCAAGFGGLDGVVLSARTAQRVLTNTEAAKFYLTASQCARLLTVLAAILGWIPLLGAVFLLVWGLIFDFAAMLVQAFDRTGRSPRKRPRGKEAESADRRRTLWAIVSGILWGLPLAALPILFRFAPGLNELWTAESARAMLSSAAILSGLAFSAECGAEGSLFAKREFNLAQAVFALTSALFAVWILFTGTGAAAVGGLPCGPEGLCAVLPAACVLLAAELRKAVQKM